MRLPLITAGLYLAAALPVGTFVPAVLADVPPYRLDTSVMGAAGAASAGASVRMNATLGQPQPIGAAAGATTRHVAGFWALLGRSVDPTGIGPPVPVDALYQNTPNPFNPATTIPFSLAREGAVSLLIHDLRGRTLAVLDCGRLTAGPHTVVWTGLDDAGRAVPSGVYFYSLDFGDHRSVRKMLVLK